MAEELRKWVCSAVVGRIYVVNKIVGELVKSQRGRLFDVHLRHRRPPATRIVLVLLAATVSLAAGCGRTNAGPTVPDPEVEVAKVVQMPRITVREVNV
jgi:hypothetical protein